MQSQPIASKNKQRLECSVCCDPPWFGFNATTKVYTMMDGSMDAMFDPLKLGKASISPKFLFNAAFGYWFSFHTGMGIMFNKM